MNGSKRFVRSVPITVFALSVILVTAPKIKAQTHVVSTEQLKQAVQSVDERRQANVEKVDEFLRMPRVQKALQTVHIDEGRAQSVVATMNDEELAQLAARTEKARSDFAAGDLSDRDLLFIIAGIAALILIIVAVR